jgi:hypothetical protein
MTACLLNHQLRAFSAKTVYLVTAGCWRQLRKTGHIYMRTALAVPTQGVGPSWVTFISPAPSLEAQLQMPLPQSLSGPHVLGQTRYAVCDY